MNYLVKTFGCRTNQAESFEFEKQLQLVGFVKALSSEAPDLVVINSCAVTAKAVREVGRMVRLVRRQHPKTYLVLTGCVVSFSQYQKKRLAGVDLVVGNDEKERLVDLILSGLNQKPGMSLDLATSPFCSRFNNVRGLVKIQDGCNNFCAYCIVPYLRSHQSSKPIEAVVEEIDWLVKKRGMREVVLTGINLELYQPGLPALLKAILKETKVERVRFGSINVGSFSDEFLDLYAQEYKKRKGKTRLARHFHLPLQSGSDRILQLMNRPYSVSQYLGLVEKIKAKIPGVAITTDLIVGFPGETEEDFAQSLGVVEKARFLKVHVFRYSIREGTQAAAMIKAKKWRRVKEEVAKQRSVELIRLAGKVGGAEKKRLDQKGLKVIPEGEVEPRVWVGYTDNFLRKKIGV